VADPPADSRVDVIAVQVLRSDPGRLIGFGVGAQLAANGLGVEADVDRDADLAVVIGAVSVSFFFSAPVGMVHRPESARRSSSSSPRWLRRTTLAEGLRLVGLGARGSSQ